MDSDLIREWYEKYKINLFRYILSITHDSHTAEDILQDTFVRLIITGIRPDPGKEQAWLYKVARNLAFDTLRKNARVQEMSTQDVSTMDEINLEYMDMISSLSKKEQEIVTLRIVSGFSHKEIAEIVGGTVHASKKRYERAINKLRKEMEET